MYVLQNAVQTCKQDFATVYVRKLREAMARNFKELFKNMETSAKKWKPVEKQRKSLLNPVQKWRKLQQQLATATTACLRAGCGK